MQRVDAVRIGLTSGLATGLAHLAWCGVVALGAAPWVIRFIFGLHFIRPPFEVTPFDLATAALLVALTAAAGFIAGWLFASIWNALGRPRGAAAAQ